LPVPKTRRAADIVIVAQYLFNSEYERGAYASLIVTANQDKLACGINPR
jgi:hypothetical protein